MKHQTSQCTISIFFMLFFLLISIMGSAQTTTIPDPNFEQALINLGIDSDATVNGQVLTVDVANVTVLDIPDNHQVDNLIGIEDFSALKVLDISHAGFAGFPGGTYPYILDLSQVHSLEELYMNSALDHGTVTVNYLDLSNNPNLKKIEVRDNWLIERIYLQGSDLSIANLDIDLSDSFDVCIQVTNANAAQNGQGVYANWTLCCNNYTFSEDCNNLATATFTKNKIQLYPNPATEKFMVNSQQAITNITIYDLQGKRVKHFAQPQANYSVASLPKGLYLIEILAVDTQKQLLKFIKK